MMLEGVGGELESIERIGNIGVFRGYFKVGVMLNEVSGMLGSIDGMIMDNKLVKGLLDRMSEWINITLNSAYNKFPPVREILSSLGFVRVEYNVRIDGVSYNKELFSSMSVGECKEALE